MANASAQPTLDDSLSACDDQFIIPLLVCIFVFALTIVILLRCGRSRVDLRLFEKTALAERSAQV
jgi:hypothetical protein